MKNFRHVRHAAALSGLLLSLAACGGSNGEKESGRGGADVGIGTSVTEAGASTTGPDSLVAPQRLAGEEEGNKLGDGLWPYHGAAAQVRYAQVVRLDLNLLDVPDIEARDVRILEGADLVEDLVVAGGELRFITPADRGKTGNILLSLDGKTLKRTLKIEVNSARFLEVGEITPFHENDPDQVPLQLKIRGMGPSNAIGHEDLVFEVDRDIEIDPNVSNALVDVAGHGVQSLQNLWTLTPSRRGLVVSRQDLKQIVEKLPVGDIRFSVSLNGSGAYNDFAREWAFIAHAPIATLAGRVIDEVSGKPSRVLAGKKIAIIGEGANATRIVLSVDEDGNFSAQGLPAGNYRAELLDSSVPGLTQTTFQIRREDRHVQVDLKYWQAANIQDSDNRTVSGKVRAKSPYRKEAMQGGITLVEGEISGEQCFKFKFPGNNYYTFQVSSSPAIPRSSYSCLAVMEIPKGVKGIEVSMLLKSLRYNFRADPIGYDFADRWSYSVSGLPRVIAGHGNSAQTYRGHVVDEGCIDVSELTKNGAHRFGVRLNASNFGGYDSLSLGFVVRSGCNSGIKISSASFDTKGKDGLSILKPLNNSPDGVPNLPGAYVSLSGATDPMGWGGSFDFGVQASKGGY